MYWEFAKLNWHLFVALIAIILLLAFEPFRQRSGGIQSIEAMDMPRVMKREKAIVVDVSDPKEYERGHIPKAKNIPLSRINTDIARLNRFKSRTVIVSCRVGNRSTKAASILKKHDFADVRTLKGGYSAWVKESLPVERS